MKLSIKITAIAALLLSLSPLAAAPVNDNFANATVIPSSIPQTVSGSNLASTEEGGEPADVSWPENPNGSGRSALGGASVWWRWTAPESGSVTIKTAVVADPSDVNSSTFDTQLGVYTGSALGALTEVASNEDHVDFDRGRSKVTFNAVGGTTYQILVDGFEAVKGNIKLHIVAGEGDVTPPPPKYTLNVSVAPSAAGTVTLSPEQPEGGYEPGTVVTLTASGTGFSGWAGAATGTATTTQVTMNSSKNVIAVFNSDNQIFFFHNTARTLAAWYLQGTSFLGATSVRNGMSVAAGWTPVGMADFNDDGSSDMLLQAADGKIAVWFFDGVAFSSAQMIRNGQSAGAGWTVVGTGDFDANGSSDVLFKHTSGQMAIWFMNGSAFMNAGTVRDGMVLPAGWRIAGAGDLSADGKADIILQHDNGRCAVWRMNGTALISATVLRDGQPVTAGWKLVGFADFNNNNTTDFLWQHDTGQMAVWYMNGTTFVSAIGVRNGQPAGAGWKALGAN